MSTAADAPAANAGPASEAPAAAAAVSEQPQAAETQAAANDDAAAEEIDPELQPFELALHLPARPLLPTGDAAAGLPEVPAPLRVAVTAQETLNDLRLTITDSPEGYWLGAFCFRRAPSGSGSGSKANGAAAHKELGERVPEWVELREVFKDVPRGQRELYVAHVHFNEADARAHVQRLRELLSGGQADPSSLGVDGGISVHDAVKHPELWHREAAASASGASQSKGKASKAQLAQQAAAEEAAQAQYKTPFLDWSGWAASPMSNLIPEQARAPRAFAPCLRSLAVAPWNPPPHYLRIQGHLLYLHVATLEGEHVFITATTHGFYLNRSTSFTFDPAPRDEPYYSCSLFDILCAYSKLFLANFARLFQDPVSQRDYYAVVPIANCLPAHPWLARVHAHTSDALRSQAAFLLTGATSPDTLEGTRDWNDELQSTRELPRATLAERLVRDRVLNRAYAEFTLAAVRAVPRVAGGEVQAMNPMDRPDARMYLCNNLFLSKGADGVDIYPHMGGDEAAHVAVSKDLHGIRALSNLDVEGLCLLGTVVVDWKGERWVAQSVVPGLFRRRDEDELEEGAEKPAASEAAPAADAAGALKNDPKEDTQVVYGGVEGPEVIRTDASFHKLFGKVAEALHLARHEVPDAEGEKKDLWLSVDSKGLRGADGRKYALDLARLNPVDIEWLERDIDGPLIGGDAATAPGAYPHRMTLLRQELLEVFYDAEFRKWAREQLAARTKENEVKAEAEKPAADAEADKPAADAEAKDAGEASAKAPEPTIDPTQFKLAFNPDAFVEFKGVAADAPAKALISDESEPSVAAVRAAARYLRDAAIPRLVTDVASGLFAAQDGSTLTRQLHVRGINVRYLGYVAQLCEPEHKDKLDQNMLSKAGPGYEGFVAAFKRIVVQEMALRASKRLLRSHLAAVGAAEAPACVSHFLNCLLGSAREAQPTAVWTRSPLSTSSETPAWTALTPESVVESVRFEVRRRYRYELPEAFFRSELRKPQLLRELAQRCGLQLKLQDYRFDAAPAQNGTPADESSTGESSAAATVQALSASAAANGVQKKKKKGSNSAAPPKARQVERKPRTTTFEPEDVLHLLPVVKDSTPKSSLAEEAFEAGRISVGRGDRAMGVELLMEGMGFHEQVYSLVHPEVARCYSLFATIVHHFASLQAVEHDQRVRLAQIEGKEPPPAPEPHETLSLANAVRYQRQAVTLSERTLGIDHPETLTQWQNLSVLERAEGNTEASLRCQQRVLQLYELLYGPDHPDLVNVLTNAALTLQNARLFEPSLKLYLSAHELALKLHGPDSIHTANLAHELSQAHTLCGDLKSALTTEKEACRVFEARLGKEDSQTKESEQFLQSLTTSAVRYAKMERDAIANANATARRAPAGLGSMVGGARAQQQQSGDVAAAAAAAPAPATASSRNTVPSSGSLDDLVAFIHGGGTATAAKGKAKTTPGMKGRRKH